MGGKSSSKSDQTTVTNNTDRRIANDGGLVAQDGSILSATFNTLDPEIVAKALDTVSASDALSGQGLSQILQLADKLTTKTQDSATALTSRYQADVLDAYSRSEADKTGGIDQKTMILLGGGALAALVMINRKKA